jgi:hypothetical protein
LTSIFSPWFAEYRNVQTDNHGVGNATFPDSFSLFLQDRTFGGGSLDLRGYIADWNGTNISNSVFASGIETMNAAGTLQEFAFRPTSQGDRPACEWLWHVQSFLDH